MAAGAQPIQGLYVGGGFGANWLENNRVRVEVAPSPGPTFKGGFSTGVVGLGSIGWGFGNGVRVEVEGDYRRNDTSHSPLNGSEKKYGAMANVLFDMDIGSPYVWPYLGAGAGVQWVQLGPLQLAPSYSASGVTQAAFAYQAMAGVMFPVPWVVGLSGTLEYRYLGVNGKRKFPALDGVQPEVSDDNNHALLLGLRYAFHVTPPPPPAPVPPPAAAPAPAPARSYLVFFDWNSADLNDRARQVVDEAAANATRVQVTRIDVSGNADRSGTPAYNMALSRRRAEAVAGELVSHGVPRQEITIQALGDTRPLVPTAAGVREPQNRRVEIVFH
jgi:outer membrane protein OmpA-like peptidoglycan-associated protein